MDFSTFLIEELVKETNNGAFINAMGLVDNEKLDPNKHNRFRYGCYLIQPPAEYKDMPDAERLELYKKIQDFLRKLYKSMVLIQKKDLGDVFQSHKVENPDKLSTFRLICDKKNSYAEIYQQTDDDKDGQWERGSFIYNLDAKNNNIHTIIHAIGHQYYYEVLSDDQAEEWKAFYDVRKYRGKNQFLTEYAKENHREDFAETFAVYVLGKDKIDELYDKPKVSKDYTAITQILSKFKRLIFRTKKKK